MTTTLSKPRHTVGSSWTHRIARWMILPLVGTPVTPNHLTTARLVSGVAACACFLPGTPSGDLWGGVLWLISAFLDRADGELARASGQMSAAGHAYDYATDVAVNALFFVAIGVGLRDSALGLWAVPLGVLAGGSIALASVLSEALELRMPSGTKAYSGVAGFDFDDMLYLLAPLAWLGWLAPVLVGAAIVAPILALLTLWRFRRVAAS